jgi:manganese/zinc/iron transport system substrate-binding protein
MKTLSALFIVILFFACSSKTKTNLGDSWFSDNKKVKVLSTIAMIDDLVAKVGGEKIDHLCLVSGEIDPHSYELVKGDDEKIDSAHIVFFNGLHLEHGASLCNKLGKHPHSIGVADVVSKRHPELILRNDGIPDPHLWMDVSLWVHTIDPIVESLVSVDPENASYYQYNADSLKSEMMAVHENIYLSVQAIDEKQRFLVTSHDAFGYFTRKYLATDAELKDGSWKKRFAAPEGLAPDGQLSVVDIQDILDHLIGHDIRVVFAESNVSRDSLKKIISASKEKKHPVNFSQRVLYGDAMGSYDEPVSSYLEMMKKNADTLCSEWGKDSL